MVSKKGQIRPKSLAEVSSGQLHEIVLSFSVCVIAVVLDFLFDFLYVFAESWTSCRGFWIVLSIPSFVDNLIDNLLYYLVEELLVHVGNVLEI